MKPRFIEPAILTLSGVGIAYQIALMRLFSIAQWHHFAYMVISIAMLGFGASGTVLALARKRIAGVESKLLPAGAMATALSLPACYWLSQCVPFDTFLLVAERAQLFYLLTLYVLLSIPFFLVSCCITLAILANPNHVGRLYCVNMVGSGLGALGAALGLFVAHPAAFPAGLAVPAMAAAWLTVAERASRRRRYVAGYVFVGLVVVCALLPIRLPVRVSQYKGLSYALQLGDAQVVAERFSPLSVVTAVHSALIRETPGQISDYPMGELGELPEQIGLYFDAGAVSPLNRFNPGDSSGKDDATSQAGLKAFAYLDYVTSAAAYRLVEEPRVLILGAGGGTDVLGALAHGAGHVVAVEVDPGVRQLVTRDLAGFAGGLYERPDVTLVIDEGRGYLSSHPDTFDLIQLPLFGSFAASAAGTLTLNESYLYTVQAFELYLSRLSDDGVLAVTCWLKTPPRDAVKLFATAESACRRYGLPSPGDHLAFLRSWNNATILVSRRPIDTGGIAAIRAFSRERGLDLCWLPGLKQEEANQYTVLERPFYYEAAQALLSVHRTAFKRDALFHVEPATDDRPYFFRFFKWSALPYLLRNLGSQWVPFVEWGYVTLVATLAQAVLASVLLILAPLLMLGRAGGLDVRKRWIFLYFAGLGGAYMFLEIAFIQRFTLFLAYPVYAVAVVLTAFLTFSGLGSLAAERWRVNLATAATLAVAAIALLTALYVAILPSLFTSCSGWPDTAKAALSVGLLAPLAFFMGIPFPSGLQVVSTRWNTAVPWAWGINACASVISATLATLLAVHLGFRAVLASAVAMYVLSAMSARRLAS